MTAKKKRTKRDVFLAEMAAVVPWAALKSVIEPRLSVGGVERWSAAVPAGGDAARLLPTAVVQPFRSPARKEALYDIHSTRAFCGLELGRETAIPDETTILNFRHLLERHDLTKAVFAGGAVAGEHLEARGALLRGGRGRSWTRR